MLRDEIQRGRKDEEENLIIYQGRIQVRKTPHGQQECDRKGRGEHAGKLEASVRTDSNSAANEKAVDPCPQATAGSDNPRAPSSVSCTQASGSGSSSEALENGSRS